MSMSDTKASPLTPQSPGGPVIGNCWYCSVGLDSWYKRCAKCRYALYCSTECARTHWKSHKKSCYAPQTQRTIRMPSKELGAPSHNLSHYTPSEMHETAMMKDFYRWLKVWYQSLVQFASVRLSVEPHAATKARTHALVLWIGMRSIFEDMEGHMTEIEKVSEQQKWQWSARDWGSATTFTVAHVRLVEWSLIISMLDCFPLDQQFCISAQQACPDGKIRTLFLIAPSFLPPDGVEAMHETIRTTYRRDYPIPRWKFPQDSKIQPEVRGLIDLTSPFFEPIVAYLKYDTATLQDSRGFTRWGPDTWEWILKKVVLQGWYGGNGQAWKMFLGKLLCKECAGAEYMPSEVKAAVSYFAKVDSVVRRAHICH